MLGLPGQPHRARVTRNVGRPDLILRLLASGPIAERAGLCHSPRRAGSRIPDRVAARKAPAGHTERGIMGRAIVHPRRSSSTVKTAVVVFPGTNCERDTQRVLTDVFGTQAELVWHQSADLSGFDAVILP